MLNYRDSFFENFEIDLDGTDEINIGARMPTQIFFVYGVRTYIGGVSPQNQPLIVPGNEDNLYLTLKMGSNDRIERIRLDDMVFGDDSGQKWLPLAFPGALDLDQSFIENPTLLDNLTVMLGLWYFPKGPDTLEMAKRWGSGYFDALQKYMGQ